MLVLALLLSTSLPYWSTFRIDCKDVSTGRGVPLVQLETPGFVSYYVYMLLRASNPRASLNERITHAFAAAHLNNTLSSPRV